MLTKLFSNLRDTLDRHEESHWIPTGARLASGQDYPPGPSAAETWRQLEAACGYTLMDPFELPQADELVWLRRLREIVETRQAKLTEEARRGDPQAVALRAAHAKHHGLLTASLVVRKDIPRELQHGVFRPGARHDALIRLSNMSEHVQHDAQRDPRGVAIKLLKVGEYGRAFDGALPDPSEADYGRTQDFCLATSPALFAKDVREFAIVRRILADPDKAKQRAQLAWFMGRRPRNALNLVRAMLHRVDHLLGVEYHSMTAFALGPTQAVKYLLRPDPSMARPVGGTERSVDHLRDSLKRSLEQARAMELCVVLPRPGRTLPVEDARIDWLRYGALCKPVARLEIPAQNPCTREQMNRAEALEWNPWHTLFEHRPLGSINRARRDAYRVSAKYRREANRGPVELAQATAMAAQ